MGLVSEMWNPEREEKLKLLFAEGLSASQIARILGPDVSRNGVLGKIHRWRLAGIPGPWADGAVRPKQPPTARVAAGPRLVERRAPRAVAGPREPEPEPMRLEDGRFVDVIAINDRMCRWPIGDPATINTEASDFKFCGHGPKEDSIYCSFHHARAYEPSRPPQPRSRRTGGTMSAALRAAEKEAA